jgi:hypothetical protein
MHVSAPKLQTLLKQCTLELLGNLLLRTAVKVMDSAQGAKARVSTTHHPATSTRARVERGTEP